MVSPLTFAEDTRWILVSLLRVSYFVSLKYFIHLRYAQIFIQEQTVSWAALFLSPCCWSEPSDNHQILLFGSFLVISLIMLSFKADLIKSESIFTSILAVCRNLNLQMRIKNCSSKETFLQHRLLYILLIFKVVIISNQSIKVLKCLGFILRSVN